MIGRDSKMVCIAHFVEELLHESIFKNKDCPAFLTDQVVMPIVINRFVNIGTPSQIGDRDQALPQQIFQGAVNRGGADRGQFLAHRLIDFLRSPMAAVLSEGFEDNGSSRGQSFRCHYCAINCKCDSMQFLIPCQVNDPFQIRLSIAP